MTLDSLLSALAIALAPFSVISVAILGNAAWQKPRIGALTERAVIGGFIALMVLSGAAITVNRWAEFVWFPLEVARVLFLAALVLQALVPCVWLFLFYTRRLGGVDGNEVQNAVTLLRENGWQVVPEEDE